MAARRRLSGLPAELRGLERRRRRRPARHHRAPRLSRPRRSRHRRPVVVADLSVARARPGLRRQRPRARRPAVRDRGGFRPPRRGRPPARHPGRARPGHEPHERPAPLVPRLAGAARRPARGLVPVARPIGLRPRRRAAPAEQLGLVLRWPGLAMGRAASAVLLPHVPGRAAGAGLAGAGCRGGPVPDGARLAGARGGRVPAGCLQHLPQAPGAALQPDPAGQHGVGPPDPRQRWRSAGLPGADRSLSRRSSTSGPVGCRSASCSTARSSERPASPPTATSCSIGSWSSQPGPGRASGARSRGARRPSAMACGRRSSSRTTIGRASPRASPTRSRAPTAMPWRGRRRCSC